MTLLPCLAPVAVALTIDVSKERGVTQRGTAPWLQRRQRCNLKDAFCHHQSMWSTCSNYDKPRTSKAWSHTTSVHPLRESGGDGSNQKLAVVFVGDAVRCPCPREQRPVAGAPLWLTECISAATSATTSGDEVDDARVMLAQSHGVATTCLTLAFV